jgi:hypothetical protein
VCHVTSYRLLHTEMHGCAEIHFFYEQFVTTSADGNAKARYTRVDRSSDVGEIGLANRRFLIQHNTRFVEAGSKAIGCAFRSDNANRPAARLFVFNSLGAVILTPLRL